MLPQTPRPRDGRWAGYFHGRLFPHDIIESILAPWAERCQPPMDLGELRRTISSVVRYENIKVKERILSGPDFQERGDAYIFNWDEAGVELRLEDFRYSGQGPKARLEVVTNRPGHPPQAGGL